jgi:hypothetical protein
LRGIGEALGISKDLVATLLREAPGDLVAAAVRDSTRIVTERIDQMWESQQDNLELPASASVALAAAALEARTFIPSPGTVGVHGGIATFIVNYTSGRVVNNDTREVVDAGSGPIPRGITG